MALVNLEDGLGGVELYFFSLLPDRVIYFRVIDNNVAYRVYIPPHRIRHNRPNHFTPCLCELYFSHRGFTLAILASLVELVSSRGHMDITSHAAWFFLWDIALLLTSSTVIIFRGSLLNSLGRTPSLRVLPLRSPTTPHPLFSYFKTPVIYKISINEFRSNLTLINR